MKKVFLLMLTFSLLGQFSCATKKKLNSEDFYYVTWELAFISGPKIAFEGLFPDKKPTIYFDKSTKLLSGNNSCNGYTSEFTIDGDKISFGEQGPRTLMYCGEGEKVYHNILEKINKYGFDKDGNLTLIMDDVVMMRFKKTAL